MSRNWNWTSIKAVSAFVYFSMLVPLLVVVVNSFHPKRIPSFPPSELSLRWYGAFFADEMFLNAVWVSTKVGIVAALGCGLLGTVTAMGFVRKQFPFQKGLTIVVLAPMLVPPVIIGLASTMFFTEIGWDRSFAWLAVMHMLITLPYAFLIVRSRLYLFDDSLEEAARTLGADHLTTFREVTFPIISPAIITAMVLSFVISFGEFTATQFWVAGSTTTVPVVIYTMLETLITPKVNVLATLVLVVTIGIPFAAFAIRNRFFPAQN